jgi:pimeloyl-ACP methyl ester carboxylesterase
MTLGESHFITAADGLKLHVRSYGARSSRLPVICLSGLARTAGDFEVLADALATDRQTPRRVLALDYRGRGLSGYDARPENYNVAVEAGDVITVAKALDASPAIFIGTSRGGIITMLLAQAQPALIAGAVLNDIGPVLERAGLLRIKSYIGKMREPRDLDDAAEVLRELFGEQFPRQTQAQWRVAAERAFRLDKGQLVPNYDVALAKTLESVSADAPIPDMWPQFEALKDKPVMAIRGANSDLLSAATVDEMARRHAGLERIEVPDQGHPPLLVEPDRIGQIAEFARRCDGV